MLTRVKSDVKQDDHLDKALCLTLSFNAVRKSVSWKEMNNIRIIYIYVIIFILQAGIHFDVL